MTTVIEYALLAGASYYDTRTDKNRFPLPLGWRYVSRIQQDPATGFEAAAFTNGPEIVISFAGTDPGDIAGDIAADIALASGSLSDQLNQAADYYLAVKANALRESGAGRRSESGNLSIHQIRHLARHDHPSVARRDPGRETGVDLLYPGEARPGHNPGGE